MSKIFFDKIPVMQVTDEMNARFRSAVNDIQNVLNMVSGLFKNK